MMTLEERARERARQRFLDVCNKLRIDDPSVTSINLGTYEKLDWEDTRQLAAALEHSTHVNEMTLFLCEAYISADGHTPILHFLRTSTSLRNVCLLAKSETTEQDFGATSAIEAVSHNKNVVTLGVGGQVFTRPAILQHMLTNSHTLTKFVFHWVEDSGEEANALAVSHALRGGLLKNTSLKSAQLKLGAGPQVQEVLFGLLSHRCLQKLTLEFVANAVSSEALRFLLGGNDNLESLFLTSSCSWQEASSAMTLLLVGLASNRGLKNVVISGSVLFGNRTDACASAWAEMLANNTTLEGLEVAGAGHFRLDCASGIAQGLSKNVSLQTLRLSGALAPEALHGLSWRDALVKNNTLRELDLTSCNIGTCSGADFESFTQGLACNTSLEILKFRDNAMPSYYSLELVEALRANGVLESLDLSCCSIEGPEGADAVRGLWFQRNLLHLDLSDNRFGGEDENVSVFSEGLPKNETLQTLKFDGCYVNSSDFCVILNSLHGSRTLASLSFNETHNICMDGLAATALKELLLGTALEKLSMSQTQVTREGIAEVATGLRGNTHLKELNLVHCGVDNEGLVCLGEVLQVNSTLESLNVDCHLFDNDGQRRFFELLPRMKGLKNLAMIISDRNESLGEAIIEGLRLNTSLESFPTMENWDLTEDAALKASMEFYLKMNRNGRKYLQEDNEDEATRNNVRADTPHIGAWPRILAKMTSPSEQDQLFFFLRRKTDLFL